MQPSSRSGCACSGSCAKPGKSAPSRCTTSRSPT
jgi:hypothetical protein